MQWMRTDIVFPDRRAILVIRRSDILREEHTLGRLPAMRSGDPNAIHAEVMKIIENRRPDLKGCTITYMQYSILEDGWEILVGHESLPETPEGYHPMRIGLDKTTVEELLLPTIVT